MKQNVLLKERWNEEKCGDGLCRKCPDCKIISMENTGQEPKNVSQQLYAKEAEHYFFYYASNIKQHS
jgi:hypothetical protein